MVSFTGFTIKSDGFSKSPFQFIRNEQKPAFSLLSEIILFETAPASRERIGNKLNFSISSNMLD